MLPQKDRTVIYHCPKVGFYISVFLVCKNHWLHSGMTRQDLSKVEELDAELEDQPDIEV